MRRSFGGLITNEFENSDGEKKQSFKDTLREIVEIYHDVTRRSPWGDNELSRSTDTEEFEIGQGTLGYQEYSLIGRFFRRRREATLESDLETTIFSKVTHPVRSINEAFHGLTRATGQVTDWTPDEELRVFGHFDPDEVRMFRSEPADKNPGSQE